jgi:hypothetical protein
MRPAGGDQQDPAGLSSVQRRTGSPTPTAPRPSSGRKRKTTRPFGKVKIFFLNVRVASYLRPPPRPRCCRSGEADVQVEVSETKVQYPAAGPMHDSSQEDDDKNSHHQPKEKHDDSWNGSSTDCSHALRLPGIARLIPIYSGTTKRYWFPVLNAASKDAEGGSKSNRRRKVSACGAPARRSMPASSHSTEIGPA